MTLTEEIELERARVWARALMTLGLALIVTMSVVGYALLRSELNEIRAKQDAIVALNPTPAQRATWLQFLERERLRDSARLQVTDAASKCRQMGQVPVEGVPSFLDRGRTITCLQNPSVAFELESEWPK